MERGRITVFALISAVLITAAVLFALLFSGGGTHAEIKLPEAVATATDASGAQSASDYSAVELTPQTVQAAIKTIDRPDSYSRNVLVTSSYADQHAVYNIGMWVKGDKLRLEIDSAEWAEPKNILLDDESLLIWYGTDTGNYYSASRSQFDSGSLKDELGMIPSYEDVLALDPTDIIDAAYVDRDGWRIMAAAKDSMGYTRYYYISAETGLLEAAEAYDDDKLIYSMTAGVAELNAPDDSLFTMSVREDMAE